MSLPSGLRSALHQVKEPDCYPVCGTWEGYIHGWRSCCPRASLGEQQVHAGNLRECFICLCLHKNHTVLQTSGSQDEWPQLNRLLLYSYNLVLTFAWTLSRGFLFNPCASKELSATFLRAFSYQSSLCSVFFFPLSLSEALLELMHPCTVAGYIHLSCSLVHLSQVLCCGESR